MDRSCDTVPETATKSSQPHPGPDGVGGAKNHLVLCSHSDHPPPIRHTRSQSKCAYVVATYLSGTRREKGVGGPSGHAQGHVTGSLAYARTWAVSKHQLHVA